MATAAKSKTKAGSNGKARAKQNGKPASKGAAKPKAKPKPKPKAKASAGGAAAKSALTTRPGGPVRLKMAGAALKAIAKKAGDRAQQSLPMLADKVREAGLDNVRTLPIQCSLDVAVPLEAAFDEWMRFDWLPDGAHRVEDIERDGDRLFGQLSGPWASGDWEAEIVDEREDESLAWQTVTGSDTSGLVTFHRLSDRLTRLEVELDVIPEGMGEALSLVLRQADRRAEKVLRGFKAQVEALDPEEYPPPAEVDDDEDEDEDA